MILNFFFVSVYPSTYKLSLFILFFRDGIHLSAEGSKIVAEEILKVLREADWKPSLHWKSMATEFAEDSPYDLVAADGKTTLNPSEWAFYRDSHWNSL